MAKIKTLNVYIDEIIKYYTSTNHKKHLFFRGLCDKNFELLPSVFRMNKTNGKTYDEKTIFLDFMQYAPENNITYDFIRDSDKVLAEMQHYGIPTRLLDWTVSPLIALYFACLDSENDGKVYIFNPWNYNQIISNYKLPNNHDQNIYARSLLVYHWQDKDKTLFTHVKEKYPLSTPFSIDLPFAYVAQFTNKRKVNQRGCFLIYGKDTTPFEKMNVSKSFLKELIIDKDSKIQILNQLNMMYINDYTVYPDYNGMEKMIKRRGSLFNL